MSIRSYILLAVVGFCIALLPAFFQAAPGYMDADYYYAGGERLAQGAGFSELILWNYLDDPAGLPHPSHGYWMPLPSILAAIGMLLSGITRVQAIGFAAARWPFLLLAALIPVLTACLAWMLSGARGQAWLAGLLAVVPGFYLAYLPTTDAFGPIMVAGALFFITLTAWEQLHNGPSTWYYAYPFLLGLLVGLIHLSRADGLIWAPVAILAVAARKGIPWRERLRLGGLVAAGYLLVTGPWFLRNLAVFGTPLSPGGGRALWINDYDELYLYPARQLTTAHWLQNGWGPILQARAWAAGLNLQTALAVQGSIFLLPLILMGAWQLRCRLAVRVGGAMWALIFLVMSVVFPFQGARGGFFHSGAALQPLFWALSPVGLERFLAWGVRHRDWKLSQAGPFFRATLVVLAMLVTGFLLYQRLGLANLPQAGWNAGRHRYQQVEQALAGQGAATDEVVMVNNAPGYYAATRRPSISIPDGDLTTLQAVAGQYHARYLVIEMEQVEGASLFASPGSYPGLQYVGTVDDARIYIFSEQ